MIDAVLQSSSGDLGEELWQVDEELQAVLGATIDVPVSERFSALGATLLQLASFGARRQSCARLLLGAGAQLDAHSAAGLGMVEELTQLLTEDPDLRDKWIDNFSPLQYAIASDRGSAVRCLLDSGVDPSDPIDKVGWFIWEDEAVSQGLAGWCPVHMASLHESLAAMEALVEGGADLGARCMFGTGVLHLAAMANSPPMLRALVGHGADLDARSGVYSAEVNDLMGGQASSYTQIVGVRDRTPLMVAAAEGQIEAVRALLAMGADTSCEDSAGRRASDYARQGFYGGHRGVARLLPEP